MIFVLSDKMIEEAKMMGNEIFKSVDENLSMRETVINKYKDYQKDSKDLIDKFEIKQQAQKLTLYYNKLLQLVDIN